MFMILARCLISIGLASVLLQAQPQPRVFRLDSIEGLKPVHVKLDAGEYRNRKAVHVVAEANRAGDSLVLVPGIFRDGSIELEVAGQPAAGAFTAARGFIGLAFRVTGDARRFECFYLRPTNGRADDQLRRNHSVQYVSEPDYPWDRLRKENPGEYESYADLEPGVWTKVKIVVAGRKAQLYVNGAVQPCLIVNDLKLGESEGGLALWVGEGTEGYFSNLVVTGAR